MAHLYNIKSFIYCLCMCENMQCVCDHVCVHVCVQVCDHVYAHDCEDQGLMLYVFLNCIPSLKIIFHLTVSWPASLSLQLSLLSLLSRFLHGGISVMNCCPRLSHSVTDINSGSRACMVGAAQMMSALQHTLILKIQDKEQSLSKSTCCSSRILKFSSQHPCHVAQNHL